MTPSPVSKSAVFKMFSVSRAKTKQLDFVSPCSVLVKDQPKASNKGKSLFLHEIVKQGDHNEEKTGKLDSNGCYTCEQENSCSMDQRQNTLKIDVKA